MVVPSKDASVVIEGVDVETGWRFQVRHRSDGMFYVMSQRVEGEIEFGPASSKYEALAWFFGYLQMSI